MRRKPVRRLLLPAVQNVRATEARMGSRNSQTQLAPAVWSVADPIHDTARTRFLTSSGEIGPGA